jgi:hypothetical protein
MRCVDAARAVGIRRSPTLLYEVLDDIMELLYNNLAS